MSDYNEADHNAALARVLEEDNARLKKFIADNEIVLKSANTDVASMTEYTKKLQAELARKDAALEKMIEAWEALGEGFHDAKIVAAWILDDMKPAIDNARKEILALTPPVGKWGHDADKCKNPDCENGKCEIHGDNVFVDCPECNKVKCKTCGRSREVPRLGSKCENYWYGKTKPCPDCNPDSTEKGKNDDSHNKA